MGTAVKLTDILEAIEFQPEEASSHLDRQTGEIILVTDEEFRAAEDDEPLANRPDWEQEAIEKAQEIVADCENRFVELPTQFDVNEYRIIQDFCDSLEDRQLSETMYGLIKGKGTFRRFKDAIERYGIADRWYRHRQTALKGIAKDWCETYGIQYVEE